MSWAVQAIGHPHKVGDNIKEQMDNQKSLEPEQTLKYMALDIINKTLDTFTEDQAVRVNASGTQNLNGDTVVNSSLSIEISPITNFIG